VSERPEEGEGELRLATESIEALATRLAQILAGAEPPPSSPERGRLISAEEVSRWWGVGRRWVYDHAEQLGARRLGAGRRPRLRFDPEEVARYLGREDDMRGSAPMRGDHRSDSLSGPRRAMVAGQAKKRPGRRTNAPRPGADVGGAMERLSARSPHLAPAARPLGGQEVGDGD
jgi:hypothetical protein